MRHGVAACSVGTSGALRVSVHRPSVDSNGGVFCYALTEDRWVVGGAINNGGVVLDWVRAESSHPVTRELSTAQLLDEAMTGRAAGSGGLLMLPYLLGSGRRAGAARREARTWTTRADQRNIVRAAVEGVALQLTLVLRSMRGTGLDKFSETSCATGGVMKHEMWALYAGERLRRVDRFPRQPEEGSGFGAALLGMEALGMIDSIDVARDLAPVADANRSGMPARRQCLTARAPPRVRGSRRRPAAGQHRAHLVRREAAAGTRGTRSRERCGAADRIRQCAAVRA